MKIDAHHHFWQYNSEEFGWIDDSLERIRRNFLPADLQTEIQAAGVDGVVSVQARQSLEETQWLLDLASANDFLKGVVGWVPLVDENVHQHLEQFGTNPKFKAVRHVVQAEPDDEFILRKNFSAGISALQKYDLVYDILIFERQLPYAIQFVDRHPDQIFVLDHIAKPRIKENLIEDWATNIRELAKRPNVFCKVSGMVTEADFKSWTPEQLKPYWETVLAAFGPDRLMFGSDWPVCLVACEYERWLGVVGEFAASLSSSEQGSLFGQTAQRVYKLA